MEMLTSFLMDHYEIVLTVLFGMIGLVFAGKKRALSLALDILHGSREEILLTMERNHEQIASFLYDRLPLQAKIFLTRAMLDKIIVEFLALLENASDIDKP